MICCFHLTKLYTFSDYVYFSTSLHELLSLVISSAMLFALCGSVTHYTNSKTLPSR